MYATKALEYLLLNPSERIDYRVEKGISIKQWYEGFKPEPIQGRFISSQKLKEFFGLDKSKFSKLNKKGFFSETKRERGKREYKISEINRIIKKEALLIPLLHFYTLIEKENWYFRRYWFNKVFKKYYEKNVLNRKKRYVTINNAARIVYELKKRKEMIENWPTLRDLNRESGLNLSEKVMTAYYTKMIKRNKIKVIKIGKYDLTGNNVGSHYKISPWEYYGVLTSEMDSIKRLNSGITSSQIASIMGVSRQNITTRIFVAKETNLLHPMEITYNGGGNTKYVLTPEEASLLINRELVIPSYETLKRKRQREILFRNYNNIPPLNIQNVSRGIEWELWQKIREGDNNAFNILLKLYEPLLNEVASNYVIPWTSQEERKNLLISALFEIVQEYSIRRTKRGDVINLATKKIKERWRKEEAPSWASLDAKLGPDGENTFLDLLDNQYQLWLKTNSKARHSE